MTSVVLEAGLGLPADAEDTRGRGHDLRLAFPAAALWGGAALAGRWPGVPALLAITGGSWVCCAVLSCVLAARASPRPLTVGTRDPATRSLAACVVLAFLAAGLLVGGIAGATRTAGPLADLTRAQRTVDTVLRLTEDPRVSRPPTGRSGPGPPGAAAAPSMTVRARLETVTSRGARLRAAVPVLLVGPADRFTGYLPGQRLGVRASLAPPRPGDTIAAVLLARAPPRPLGRPPAVQRAAGWLRERLRVAAEPVPRPAGGLLPALVVGDTSGLDPVLEDDFRAAGMSHLTAVSGANCAIATGAVLVLLGRTRLGARSRALAAMAALVGFVILARPSASVLRAGAMATVGLAALALGRPRAVLPALAAAVIVLVLGEPTLALSAGFALSVLATAGMVIWGPGWQDGLRNRLAARGSEVRGSAGSRWSRGGADRVAAMLAVAAAAQLACTPVLAWLGGGVSLVAIPANVLAAPAVAPATLLGLLTMAVAALHPSAAEPVARLAGLPCQWLVLVAGRAAALPGATIGWPEGFPGAATALAATVLGLALARRRVTRRLLAAAVVGLLLSRFLLLPRLDGWPPPGWRLVACDVGQGDAIVLRAGADSAVVVDVGPDPELISSCLRRLDIRRVPLLVLSHLHTDHAGGLGGVVGRIPVGEIVVSPLPEPAEQWAAVERAARSAGVAIRPVHAGAAGTAGSVRWRVIGPTRVLRGTESDPNNASVVLLADAGGVRVLLTGDAEPPEQRQVARQVPVAVDVVKVAHHGAEEQVPEFLTATAATVAVISAGLGNTYGHPDPATLARLREAGLTVARTDLHGDVAVIRGPADGVGVVARRAGGREGGGPA